MSLYTPDRVFWKRMKAINPKLLVAWNRGIERWQIFEVVGREIYQGRHVLQDAEGNNEIVRLFLNMQVPKLSFTVKDPLDAEEGDNGSYMPLDERTLWKLHEMDIARLNRYADPVDELEAKLEAIEAEGEKEQDYQLDELTGEMGDDAARVNLSEWER